METHVFTKNNLLIIIIMGVTIVAFGTALNMKNSRSRYTMSAVQPGGCDCEICCVEGSCPSWFYGDWSGFVCGCIEGDSKLAPAPNKCGGVLWCPILFDAETFLRILGYCNSWYGETSEYDFTKAINNGKCRYQAIITIDKRCIRFRDDPEPNPQPAFFCNGNPDLWFPWGCVRDAIERWHVRC